MLAELRRHAATGSALRGGIAKTAGGVLESGVGMMGRGLWRATKPVLGWGLKNPGKALVLGAGAVGAAGRSRQAAAGFNPAVHRAQLGMAP